MNIRYFKILENTRVEGPGMRFCIWVQGCSRGCKGCWAKHSHPHSGGKLISVTKLFEMIKAQKNIEGVTFLGGEPFEQAKALGLLAKKVQGERLSVVTFTGATFEELGSAKNKDVGRLLKYTDLLIDGAFEEENFDISRPWVGSSNQKYHFLSGRYDERAINGIKNKAEVRIQRNGSLFINGMGDFNKINKQLLWS